MKLPLPIPLLSPAKNRRYRQLARLALFGLCLALVGVAPAACDRDAGNTTEAPLALKGPDGELSLHDVRLRPVPPGADLTAAYLRIENRTSAPERLLGAALVEHAGRVEIHESLTDAEGIMRMRPLASLEIPAESAVELQPGGNHLMLLQLEHEFQPGETTTLELRFATAGKRTVTARVMGND